MIIYIFPESILSNVEKNAGKIDKAIDILHRIARLPVELDTTKFNTEIILDSDLPFTLDDIPDDIVYGDGVTIKTLTLKDGSQHRIITIVLELPIQINNLKLILRSI